MAQGTRGKDSLTEKDVAKERKRRGNRKYGQAQQKHAKRGVISCVISGIITCLLGILFAVVYIDKGHASIYIGAIGLIYLILSWVGCVFAFRGFRERDKNYSTCKIGIVCNGFIFVFLILVFLRGIL
ncbi:MAG: DUF6142 family protein [Lachnospiraceae bacterium]